MENLERLKDALAQVHLSDGQKARILAGCQRAERRQAVRKWIPAFAACAVLALALTFAWAIPRQSRGPEPALQLAHGAAPGTTDMPTVGTLPATEPGAADSILIYELDASETPMDCALYYDPERYEDLELNQAEAEDWYGRVLAVDPAPEGLLLSPGGPAWRIVRERATGEIVHDQAYLSFWNDWGETGGHRRMVWEGGQGFTVTLSKTGIVSDCIVVWPEDMGPSTVSGVEVSIGHRVMGACYNENKEPEFTYDVYIAQFTLDGVVYEVQTENLDQDALLQILHSLIGPA